MLPVQFWKIWFEPVLMQFYSRKYPQKCNFIVEKDFRDLDCSVINASVQLVHPIPQIINPIINYRETQPKHLNKNIDFKMNRWKNDFQRFKKIQKFQTSFCIS